MLDLRLDPGTARYLKLEHDMRVNEDLLLLQCESEADAASIEKHGAALKSRGGTTDSVLMCLADKTLACKYVETTNALFLVDLEPTQNDIENTLDGSQAFQQEHPNARAGLLSQLQSDAKAETSPPILIQAQSHFMVETAHCSIPIQDVQQALQQHRVDRATIREQSLGGIGMTWTELSAAIMASDKDIIDALQSVRAIPWLSACGEGWALLDETLLLDALEHILLTCIEQKLQLNNFDVAELLSALQAEDNPLSQALTVHGSCIVWHILRMYGTHSLAFAAWDHDALAVQPQFPGLSQAVGFDSRKVASGCMHAVLSRHCQRMQMDPSTGKAVVNIADVQDDWNDIFPAPHLWPEWSTLREQGSAAWSSQLMLDACRGLALQYVKEGITELRVLFETHLHPTAKKRLDVLFSIKSTWTKDEIEPYLHIHDCECSNPTELLLRYSRTIREGQRMRHVLLPNHRWHTVKGVAFQAASPLA